MRPWSRSGCLSLTPGSSPLSHHDGGRPSPGPASCTRIAPSWSQRQWNPWLSSVERSDHARHPRSSPTLANPPSHSHGPPAVPNPQISQSLKLPQREAHLAARLRVSKGSDGAESTSCTVDPPYEDSTRSAHTHTHAHIMQPALGFSGSFPLFSSLSVLAKTCSLSLIPSHLHRHV